MGVGVGDIFLFFGWFQRTSMDNGKIFFDNYAQNQHIIFGYLQIGRIIYQDDNVEIPDWMSSHPHFGYDDPTNTIYVAREKLSWNEKCSGAGTFNFHKDLVLTKEGLQFSRSQWDLPKIFKGISISYHDSGSWKNEYFQSAERGQEFVVTCTKEIEEWAKRLINKHACELRKRSH